MCLKSEFLKQTQQQHQPPTTTTTTASITTPTTTDTFLAQRSQISQQNLLCCSVSDFLETQCIKFFKKFGILSCQLTGRKQLNLEQLGLEEIHLDGINWQKTIFQVTNVKKGLSLGHLMRELHKEMKAKLRHHKVIVIPLMDKKITKGLEEIPQNPVHL